MELTYPHGVYQMVYKVCFIHPLHITSAFYYDMAFSGWLGIILFVTSLNYWQKPYNDSLARKIDMVCVHVILPYQYYLSFFTTNTLIISSTMTLGMAMYPLSNHLKTHCEDLRLSAFCHCLLHFFLSISLCFMYKDYYEDYIKSI